VTFRYMVMQLQPNVIANYTTRGFYPLWLWGRYPDYLRLVEIFPSV